MALNVAAAPGWAAPGNVQAALAVPWGLSDTENTPG